MRIATLPLVLATLAVLSPVQALAWGGHGHRVIGVAAMEALPDEVPAFLRDPTAISQIGELSREPDRSKGAGKIHDSNRDSAHFVDIDDTDVHFIYINRHIEGTQRLERWRISKKLTEMNIVSAV